MWRVRRGLVVIVAMLFVVPAAPAGADHVQPRVNVDLTVTHALSGATLSVGDRVSSPGDVRGKWRDGLFGLALTTRSGTRVWYVIDSLHEFGNRIFPVVRMSGFERRSGDRVSVLITSLPPRDGYGPARDAVIQWYDGAPSLDRCDSESVAGANGIVELGGFHIQDSAWLAPFCASSLGDPAQLPS